MRQLSKPFQQLHVAALGCFDTGIVARIFRDGRCRREPSVAHLRGRVRGADTLVQALYVGRLASPLAMLSRFHRVLPEAFL